MSSLAPTGGPVRTGEQLQLIAADGWCRPSDVSGELSSRHYLGPSLKGWAWRDRFGCLVLSRPTSRMLPESWLELSRWCLVGVKNGGSKQWAAVARAIRSRFTDCTTVVSYSDPSVGHTGALYRACGWLWAPTWHRIVTPPTGNGSWSDETAQAAKDRWVFAICDDPDRESVLRLDESYIRRFPECEYRDGRGADYKRWRLRDLEK